MRTKLTVTFSDLKVEALREINCQRTKSSKDMERLNESIFYQLEKDRSFIESNCDDDWLDKETITRQRPLIDNLTQQLKQIIRDNENFILTVSRDLFCNVAQEVSRLSRDEPGGVTSCRVRLNMVKHDRYSGATLEQDLKSGADVQSHKLGCTFGANVRIVETSTIDVYLLPSNSVLSRLHSLISSLSLKNFERKCRSSRPRTAVLRPEFVLVKQKLFRSNNTKQIVLIQSSYE